VRAPAGGGLNTEAGIEGALNTLGNKIGLFKGGAIVPLPASDVRLSEQRAEGFFNATWHAAPDLALEAGLRYETSYFKQRQRHSAGRDAGYLKPRAQLTWNVAPRDELPPLVGKKAGRPTQFRQLRHLRECQLEHGNAGNINLVPYTQPHRPVDLGASLPVPARCSDRRNQQIKNTWDQIPYVTSSGYLRRPGQCRRRAAHRIGRQLNLPMDWTGVPGFTVQGTATRRWSHVIDPLTGERRRISGDTPYEGEYRGD